MLDVQPKQKAIAVVNVVIKMLNPISSAVFSIRSIMSVFGSSRKKQPEMINASSNPTPKNTKSNICVMDVKTTPKTNSNPYPAIMLKKMETTAINPNKLRDRTLSRLKKTMQVNKDILRNTIGTNGTSFTMARSNSSEIDLLANVSTLNVSSFHSS